METEAIIANHYNARKEDERFTTRHGAVEFATTRHYIDRYLPKGGRILEAGCGTGQYALHYAERGFPVDAVELVPSNLDVLRQNQKPHHNVKAVLGNALDLSAYAGNTFDITLVLGPLYHLFSEAERKRCLTEAVRVTKKGGVIFAAYCQFDAAMVQTGFLRGMFSLLTENNLLDEGALMPIDNPAGVFSLTRFEQVQALCENLPVLRLHYVGTDMFSCYFQEQLAAMDHGLFEKWLAYTLSICENKRLTGVSNHALDILRKL